MDKVVSDIILRIPILLWPIVIGFSLYGVIILIKTIYCLKTQVNQDYKKELIEHLEFKGKRLEEFKNYNSELKEQLNIQRDIADRNLKIALDILNEKNNQKKEYIYALLTCMWMLERERFFRKIFITLTSRAILPQDMKQYLNKNLQFIINMIESNDNLYFHIGKQNDETFEEKIVSCLSKEYLDMPINDDLAIISSLRKEVENLPSFIQPISNKDN